MPNLSTIQEASISVVAGGAGQNALITAVAGKKIRVMRILLTLSAATTIKFQDGNTDFTGAMTLASGTPLFLMWQEYDVPLFIGSTNTAFNINVGAAVTAAGRVWYTLD